MQEPSNDGVTRADINRLADKIDNLHTIFVPRQEYTTMHGAIMMLISTVTAQVTQLTSTVEKNREKVERTNAEGGKWILEQFDQLEQRIMAKFDEQCRQNSGISQWLVGLLYGTASSIIVGVLIVVLTHIWK